MNRDTTPLYAEWLHRIGELVIGGTSKELLVEIFAELNSSLQQFGRSLSHIFRAEAWDIVCSAVMNPDPVSSKSANSSRSVSTTSKQEGNSGKRQTKEEDKKKKKRKKQKVQESEALSLEG